MVLVRDIEVGKTYNVNGVAKTLVQKEEQTASRGFGGYGESYYTLTFSDGSNITKGWDAEFDLADNKSTTHQRGGRRRRRTRRGGRKGKKTRRNRHSRRHH